MNSPHVRHYREIGSSRPNTSGRNFNTDHTHNQGVFAHGHNLDMNKIGNSNNLSSGHEPNFARSNRKLKEPDLFDGQRTEWPDYICHFEQVAQWNQWTDGEKAAQLVYEG